MIRQARTLIQPGDLILRTGTDYASEQIKALSKREAIYSHSGIAMIDSGKVYVCHVETDYAHIHNKVKKELLDSFCNPAKNLGFAIARYQLTDDEKSKLLVYMNERERQQVAFDIQFDLATDDKMYCSEMIYKGLARATNKRILIPTDRITDRNKFKLIKRYFKLTEKQIVTRDIIPIDHLYLNPWCSVVMRYPFQTL
ncbi:YiiX/YebB-like N1pC/P60 family cysteine hydrolase [Paraflavitalea speifideaquila]|uniref:YiiX/YebB-like N1pC/P60 family cysteine hydrolase n=1 Tax=Paraflavitalea speifideaquila TaxID=3076558 RepID=UPI0028E8DA8A|nr:YiiX/YebB-like N1pC/P60 family cysteine hydrolase [Paraflavitalea speifideiaquila]